MVQLLPIIDSELAETHEAFSEKPRDDWGRLGGG